MYLKYLDVKHSLFAFKFCKNFFSTTFENLIVSKECLNESVGLIRINRPKYLNALSAGVTNDLAGAFCLFNCDPSIKCIVLTGTDRVFSVGADVSEMLGRDYAAIYANDFLAAWDDLATTSKPVVAAVNGLALGGGCELAMMADVLYAGERARFGQPEIKLGTIPGAGGTQRLIRAVGKSRAMEMILSGETISAEEAMKSGLVSRVYPAEVLVERALDLAGRMARFSSLALRAAKEAVNASYNSTLSEGLRFERRLFQASFATNDCREGMSAYLDKRNATFTDS